jgi:predicted ATPase
MKIQSLHFLDVGSLGEQDISLINDWDDSIEARVLFSGVNGSGKSTVLRAVAMLWEALGYWLDHQKIMQRNHIAREWLQRWNGCGVILTEVTHAEMPIGLMFGDLTWCEKLKKSHPNVSWIGEGVARTGKQGNPKRELFLPKDSWFQELANARRKMILSFEKSDLGNVFFLDAEERRWVSPRRNVGEHLAESPAMRWLPRYIATEDWKGQLEASLITLKTTHLHTYHEVIRNLNEFLSGKEIDPDIKAGENRLRVKIKNQRGQTHSLDDLSAGEHQVLILIYLLSRWAQQGTIVLIDEPDLYLHPSLVNGLLANLENLVTGLNGQLIITSHQPEIWRRYENSGKRIELSVDA